MKTLSLHIFSFGNTTQMKFPLHFRGASRYEPLSSNSNVV